MLSRFVFIVALAAPATLHADTLTRGVVYSGHIDRDGSAVSGPIWLSFRLFESAAGDDGPVWTSPAPVQVIAHAGAFTTALQGNAVEAVVQQDVQLWVEVLVGEQQDALVVLGGRQRLNAQGQALWAAEADHADHADRATDAVNATRAADAERAVVARNGDRIITRSRGFCGSLANQRGGDAGSWQAVKARCEDACAVNGVPSRGAHMCTEQELIFSTMIDLPVTGSEWFRLRDVRLLGLPAECPTPGSACATVACAGAGRPGPS
jgi:hypothetical protein